MNRLREVHSHRKESSGVLLSCGVAVRITPASGSASFSLSTSTLHHTAHIHVALHHAAPHVTHHVLSVRLTDEEDPFFLYTMDMGEEEFANLKIEQGLLVDFSAFATRLCELIKMVVDDMDQSAPRFLLQLHLGSGSGGSASLANLNIVETNTFKHLVHLSLRMEAGTDETIKRYLAGCLRELKDHATMLEEQLKQNEQELAAKTSHFEETIAATTRNNELVQNGLSSRLSEASVAHLRELSELRERHAKDYQELQRRAEQDRRDIEQRLNVRIETAESRVELLDKRVDELSREKYTLESQLRDLKSVQSQRESELDALRPEISRIRLENQEHETSLAHQASRIASLMQELQEKEQAIARISQSRMEQTSIELHREIARLEDALRTSAAEIMKGNEIIAKLQNELRTVKEKLKIKNKVTLEQEKLLDERTVSLEILKKDAILTEDALLREKTARRECQETVEQLRAKLESCEQVIKTNENIIRWLNSQHDPTKHFTRPPPAPSTWLNTPNSEPPLPADPKAYLKVSPTSVSGTRRQPLLDRTNTKQASPFSPYLLPATTSSNVMGSTII